jgi:hypothetical protein
MLISQSLDTRARALGLHGKISTHNQRWNWTDGVLSSEVDSVRIYRVRQDLRVITSVNNLGVEWTLQGRLSLLKALGRVQYRSHYKYGSRLRPASRLVPLP